MGRRGEVYALEAVPGVKSRCWSPKAGWPSVRFPVLPSLGSSRFLATYPPTHQSASADPDGLQLSA